ncbi:transcriptional regulator PpsR [Thiocapsa marina]|uniref:Transcriptional regulator PpsR n=1 Tax=Thiocapsa marina 5811 TaxID=768671 RepID=F9U8K5_9GAMM|nr:transcriptional regulator PpsR [Thiocapsa marina]EGV19617.1 transcriptional regulator PpsR [Thiocapsa marina 5811]
MTNLAQPDVTIFLDHAGVIRRAALSPAFRGEALDAWVGRPWAETVDSFGSESLRSLVDDARDSGVSAFRQVNQIFPSGLRLPIEYTAVRLGGDAGLVAIGRSLQAVTELQTRLVEAQQTMERDYWKLREVETRYRLLFGSSSDAVILLRVTGLAIQDINPAASRALGGSTVARRPLVGKDFSGELVDGERDLFHAMLRRLDEQGSAPGILLHLGVERAAWMVRASRLASEAGSLYLLQLTATEAASTSRQSAEGEFADVLIERLPDGFVVTDRDGLIHWVNPAFLDLVQMPTAGGVLQQSLGLWLDRPGADMSVLLTTIARLGVVRPFSTRLRGELGGETEVEISAAGDLDTEPSSIGILFRDVGRRLPRHDNDQRLGGRLNALSGRIGKGPLRALVDEAISVMEQHYIEEALELTRGNRTATADLLGLSRQSLYVKLKRYGMDQDTVTDPGSRT